MIKIENIIRRVLREEQEEKILKIPGIRFFNNDWNILQKFLESQGNPRYSIGGNLDLSYSDIETLGNLVRVEGDLDLYDNESLQSLGNLEYVGGDLNLSRSDIKSLGNLVRVEGNLGLYGNESFQSLGNLEYVGGYLDLRLSDIKSLGNLEYVGGNLDLIDTDIETLGNLEYVGGNLHLYVCKNLKSLGNLKYVGGDLDLRHTPLLEKYTEDDIRKMIKVVGVIDMG
jgi:hypothetical protein